MNGCGPECFAFWSPGQTAGEGDVLYGANDGFANMSPVNASAFADDRSARGVYGLAGNVSEWTRDCMASYTNAPQRDPVAACADDQTPRVVRGGSWNTVEAASARATFRLPLSPATQTADLGFRCVSAPRVPSR